MSPRIAVPLALALVGPFVLAFFAGGYFDQPRLVAALAACALVVAGALVARRPLPASRPGRLALAGLAALAAWTALSILWAPLSTPAVADADRLLLYLAAFTAALALLERRAAVRLLEPAIALGVFCVLAYALSERLLPGVFELPRDSSALGRLSRPLTYWNAMGALAVLGTIAAVRVAGDATRHARLRTAAAAAVPVLGLGVYLSFSRGALAALAVGFVLLALLAHDRAQLRALAVAIPAGVLAAVAAGLMDGVRSLDGALAAREREGAFMLGVLVLLSIAAAVVARRERAAAQPRPELAPRTRRVLAASLAVVVIGAFALAAASSERRAVPPSGASSARLVSVESVRGDYWRIALGAFADHPLRGLGSGGFAVVWLRERDVQQGAVDAHSLYVETAAELGIVGLAALALFIGAAGWAAARGYARDPVAAAGLIAAAAAWLLHAGLDWLWEVPAVTLLALLLAAGLVRLADPPDGASA